MAETLQKRPREDDGYSATETPQFDNSKRQKPYTAILSLLDDDDEEETQEEESSRDISAIFKTLQRELYNSTTTSDVDPPPPEDQAHHHHEDVNDSSVMRRLLEASDDELGIPNSTVAMNPVEDLQFDFEHREFMWEIDFEDTLLLQLDE